MDYDRVTTEIGAAAGFDRRLHDAVASANLAAEVPHHDLDVLP